MSLLKKVQKRSEERKFTGSHPILRMGLDRNVIDAYFTGLVFAAVADDESIDAAERAKLKAIGLALNLSEEDSQGMMDEMLSRDEDGMIASAEEAVGALKGTKATQLFLCEWSQIWMTHNPSGEDLDAFRLQLCEWMGGEYAPESFKLYDSIDGSNPAALSKALGEECALYLSRLLAFQKQSHFADEPHPRVSRQKSQHPHTSRTKTAHSSLKENSIENNDCSVSGCYSMSPADATDDNAETASASNQNSHTSRGRAGYSSSKGYLIDQEKCIRCGGCYSVCPADAIDGNIVSRFVIKQSRCTQCGKCVEACDYQAIF